jgi:hypothetical protein
VTAQALSIMICLASGAFGRQWPQERCDERASQILVSASRHDVDPVLMLALEAYECDMREDVDARVYRVVRGKKKLAGFDACPMGVRVMDVGRRRRLGPADLYEVAAAKLERWRDWCRSGHPGGGNTLRFPHHHVAHYNQGNPEYSYQVLAVAAAIGGRPFRDQNRLRARTLEIVRRLRLVFSPKRS